MNNVYNDFKFSLNSLGRGSTSPFDMKENLNPEFFKNFWDELVKEPEFKFDKLKFDFELVDSDKDDDGDIFDYVDVTVTVPFAENPDTVKKFLYMILEKFAIDADSISMKKTK